jgi:hypothetical protein
MPSYHALIRTHHITSRKKVARLKAAAKQLGCSALLRSGGAPGIMYVRGDDREQVQKWVNTVHELRYKDYQLAMAVGPVEAAKRESEPPGVREVETVKDMAAAMEAKGLQKWWRVAMGFVREE